MTSQLTETIRVPMRMPNYWRLHVEPWRDGQWRFSCEGGGDGFVYCTPIKPEVSVCATRAGAAECAAMWSLAYWRTMAEEPVDRAEQLASRRVGVKALERFCEKRGIDINDSLPPQPQQENDVVTKTKLGKSAKKDAAASNGAAKKKPPRAKQKKIPDTFDPVPRELEEKVEEYNDSLGEWQRLQKQTDTLREDVIEMMKAHDVEKVPLDEDTEFVRVHKDETWTIKKVKVKKAKAPKAESDAGYDDEREED